MEAEADNTWVYGRDKAPIDRLVAKFNECARDEAGIRRLIKNASKDMLECRTETRQMLNPMAN